MFSPLNRFKRPGEPDIDYTKKEEPKRVAVREQLLDLLKDQFAAISTGGQVHIYFETPSGFNCFAVPLNSSDLRGWLTVRQQGMGRPAPTDAQIRQATRVREAQCFGGTTRTVRTSMNVRYGWDHRHSISVPQTDKHGKETRDFLDCPHDPAYVLSLDTRRGEHVAVTSERWVIHPSHTAFRFDPLQQPIPEPVPTEGDPNTALQPFRKLLRLDDARHDATWQTLLDWTLAAMRAPKDASFHNYPILNLMGEESSGKSITAKLLTQLLDPTLTPVHSIPATERRLHGIAANHHILTFDDTGKINPQKSRYLSRLATGVNSHHPSLEGMLVRPIILTTSEERETRHLAGKVVDVELPPIEAPRTPEQIQSEFEPMRPQILGALLTLLVQNFNTPPPNLPNRKTKKQKIEQAVTEFLKQSGGSWQGTVSDLVGQISACPSLSSEALGRALNEMKSLIVTHLKRKNKERPIHLQLKSNPTLATTQPLKVAPIVADTRVCRAETHLGACPNTRPSL